MKNDYLILNSTEEQSNYTESVIVKSRCSIVNGYSFWYWFWINFFCNFWIALVVDLWCTQSLKDIYPEYEFLLSLLPVFISFNFLKKENYKIPTSYLQPLKDGLFWSLECMKRHKRMICRILLVSLGRSKICI